MSDVIDYILERNNNISHVYLQISGLFVPKHQKLYSFLII